MTANPAQSPPPQIRTIADLHALGRAAQPWNFLPLAIQTLAQHPADQMLRFLMSANIAHLGLRTFSLDLLTTLDAQAAASPEVAQLRSQIERLPDDRIDTDARMTRARDIAKRLEARGTTLPRASIAAFADALSASESYRDNAGNAFTRPAGATDPTAWSPIAPHRQHADAFASQQLTTLGEYPRPFLIEGADPPWIFANVMRATRRRPNGYAPRVILAQADPSELLAGLTLLEDAELDAWFAEDRLEILTGTDASERIQSRLEELQGTVRTGPVITLPTAATKLSPSPADIITKLDQKDAAHSTKLAQQIQTRDAARTASWWNTRYEQALTGKSDPLRVLVCTTRFSTYIRHASADLAGALEAMGCKAELLIEPDENTAIDTLGKRLACESLDPDLIVCINYPRAALNDAPFPEGIPFVCWTQDAMPHLFDEQLAQRQTPRDFFIGHVFREMVIPRERGGLGFPPQRMEPMPVVASCAKFNDEPIDRPRLEEHACEIAFATHHAETPERMRDRLIEESGGSIQVRDLISQVHEAALECATDAHLVGHHKRLNQRIAEILASLHADATPHAISRIMRQAAEPLVDRVFRHQAVAFAAQLADENDWRFHLYGRDWDEHPEYARFARPPIDHDAQLKASYRAAGIHLHASARTMIHQRPIECLLSGGLPVCRLFRDGLAVTKQLAEAEIVEMQRDNPTDPLETTQQGWQWRTPADGGFAMAYQALLDRLGIPNHSKIAIKHSPDLDIAPLRPREEADIAWLMGDLSETSFWDAESLERVVRRAIERPAWKRGIVRGSSARARTKLTTRTLATRMVRMVARSLAGEALTDDKDTGAAA